MASVRVRYELPVSVFSTSAYLIEKRALSRLNVVKHAFQIKQSRWVGVRQVNKQMELREFPIS